MLACSEGINQQVYFETRHAVKMAQRCTVQIGKHVLCKYKSLINMSSAWLIKSSIFPTLTDTGGHVYARSLRALRTNPFGEKIAEKHFT